VVSGVRETGQFKNWKICQIACPRSQDFISLVSYKKNTQGARMGIEVGGLLGLIVLIADVWAIIKTVQSSATTGSKVFWVVFILLLPVLGLLIWLIAGPKSVR